MHKKAEGWEDGKVKIVTPSAEQIAALAHTEFEYSLHGPKLELWTKITREQLAAFEVLQGLPDYKPPVKYPRKAEEVVRPKFVLLLCLLFRGLRCVSDRASELKPTHTMPGTSRPRSPAQILVCSRAISSPNSVVPADQANSKVALLCSKTTSAWSESLVHVS